VAFKRGKENWKMRSLTALQLCGVVVLSGCSWWESMTVRSQSPEEQTPERPSVRLVGDLAVPAGMCMLPTSVEAVGLVTGLDGTGSDAIPSPRRQRLLGEMQTRGVESPGTVLASPDTAMVMVRGLLPPGIQKGDHFDLEVRTPSRSETTSLRGGWLLETELREFAELADHQIHTGHPWGQGAGPVMVDPSAEANKDHVATCRGRILGGGVAQKSRPLGLELKPESQSVLASSWIETAVNKRFHTTYRGIKRGVAKAKTDRYVELSVHPRYKDNIQRYVQVVRAIGVRESEAARQERLLVLGKQLLDPITCSRAALQLEAIGHQAIDVLRKGIRSSDPEVRFRSAEALAFLDQSEAAEPLCEAAREQPAFRVFALSALSAMDDVAAAERLRELLDSPSAETRYGAFRALSAMNRKDPTVMGEVLGGQFSYHVLNTSQSPMIHVTRSRRPEIVLFGRGQRLRTPLAVDAGNQIMVVGTQPGRIAVSKFAVGEMDQRRLVSDRVDDVIRAIVQLGGTYPDVVQALQEAKEQGALDGRFEVDALPEAGRAYTRVANAEVDGTNPDG
jgi:flagellar basal body P-ring protein FlgI